MHVMSTMRSKKFRVPIVGPSKGVTNRSSGLIAVCKNSSGYMLYVKYREPANSPSALMGVVSKSMNTSEYCKVDSRSSGSEKTCSFESPTRRKKFFHARFVGAKTVCMFSASIISPGTHIPSSGSTGFGKDPLGIKGGMMMIFCCADTPCRSETTPPAGKLVRNARVKKYASAVMESSGNEAMSDSTVE